MIRRRKSERMRRLEDRSGHEGGIDMKSMNNWDREGRGTSSASDTEWGWFGGGVVNATLMNDATAT